MPLVTFIAADGMETTLTIASGRSVMQGAVADGLDGIAAECGGQLVCATCHVYLQPGPAATFPPVSDLESEMLDHTVSERRENSRLSCQLVLSDANNGVVVRLPPAQV